MKKIDFRTRLNETILLGFFLLTSLEGLVGMYFLLTIPTDPKNVYFAGFSVTRLALLGGMLVGVLLWLGLLIRLITAPVLLVRLEKKITTLVASPNFTDLLGVCFGTLIGIMGVALGTTYLLPDHRLTYRLIPLAPISSWLLLFSLQTLVYLGYKKGEPWSSKKVFEQLLLPLIIMGAIFIPRTLALDHFVSPDENRWLDRSGNFLKALGNRDYAGTYQREHPGVITMWAGAAGYMFALPKETISDLIASEYKPKVFIRIKDVDSIVLLEAGRQVLLVFHVMLLLLAYFFIQKLLGRVVAVLATLFVAFDPFYLAHTRFLHLDGILSSLILVTLIAFICYIYSERRIYLGVSGITTGYALLAKSPALFLVPFFGLLISLDLWDRIRTKRTVLSWKSVIQTYAPFILWVFLVAIIFTAFFPAMWVDPLSVVTRIYENAFEYARGGHGSAVFFNGQIFKDGRIGANYFYFYPFTFLWRTTPLSLIGLLLGLYYYAFRSSFFADKMVRRIYLSLGIFAVLFTLFMTLGSKKFDRYLLPIHPVMDIMAALGWVALAKWVLTRYQTNSRYIGMAAIIFILSLIQAVEVTPSFPYYLTYYNSLFGGIDQAKDVMLIGWGEGIDEAARYLNTKPNIADKKVISWYSPGSFSYIYDGKNYLGFNSEGSNFLAADYAVVYFHQWQRQLPNKEVLDQLAKIEPEHIIEIQGLNYVQIFNLSELKTKD